MQTLIETSSSQCSASSRAQPARDRRIAVFYPMAGDTMGGSHVSLLGLLEGLDQNVVQILIGIEVPGGRLAQHYAAFDQVADPAPPKVSITAGAPFGLASVLQTFSGLRKRREFLVKHEIDIVHTNDGRTHATWALATKLAGKKLVWHHRGNPNARGLRYVARWLADQIITVSSFAMPGGAFAANGRAKVIYSPFDVTISADRAAARQRILAEFDLPAQTIVCGYFGTFIPRKRPAAFVDSVIALSKLTSRPVKGLLFGEATNAAEREAIVEKIAHSDGLVADAGYRTPGHEWIAGCDLLIVPAVDEPLGRTLVEAMLVGTPVVATHSGGNPEALAGDCGVLVPDIDQDSMAEAAAAILADPERCQHMVNRAQSIAREKFSRKRHVQQVVDVYRKLSGSAL
jgi:glycosyltransferase involved in cell wall biosynthesis